MKKVLLGLGFALLLISACTTGGSSSSNAMAKGNVLEAFEGEDLEWFAVVDGWKDGDNSTSLELISKDVLEGKQSAKLVSDIKQLDKPATYYTENASIQDWSKFKTLSLDVNNTLGADTKMVVAICTGDNWDWQESEAFPVKAGINKGLTIDVAAGTFKGAGSNWEFKKGGLHDLDKIKRVVVRYFGVKLGPTSIILDNLSLK